MVPILTTNDVFEPSYNDFKFMVWNDNYICINLIRERDRKTEREGKKRERKRTEQKRIEEKKK